MAGNASAFNLKSNRGVKMAKKMLIVSDLHAGSLYGLMPPHFNAKVGATEFTYQSSPAQKKLWEKWVEMVKEVGQVDDVVINGDLVDGKNKKSEGKGAWSTDMNCQVDCAVGMIMMIKAKRYHIASGSPYHQDTNIDCDELCAVRMKDAGYDVKFGNELVINYTEEGKRYHFAHSIGVSGVMTYRTTAIAKEMMSAVLHEKQMGKFDGIFRAHCHYFVKAEFPSSFGVIGPGWKMRDDYGTKKGFGIIPKCGYLLLKVGKNEKGEIEERLEKRIFSPSVRSTMVETVIR